MQDDDVIREFLVESHENLSRLDRELVELEKHPKDAEMLASIFRTIHTIKGTCGFLAFSTLERISHQAETLLSQLRDGRRELNPSLVSLVLDTVDATRKVLGSIEANGSEGPDHFEELTERLRIAAQLPSAEEAQGVAGMAPAAAVEHPDCTVVADHVEDKAREGDATKSSAVADANIRVGVGLLDKLMDLVGGVGVDPQSDPPIQYRTGRCRSQRDFTAAQFDHHRVAGGRHEDAHATDRHGLE